MSNNWAKGNSYVTEEEWLLSNKFDVSQLCRGIKILIDKLETFKEDPVSKSEIKYYISEILKGTLILDKFCNAYHDEILSEEVIDQLEKKDIERNMDFILEHSDSELKKFYMAKDENERKIYEKATEKVA
jgi:hypothetical protein